MMMMMMTTTMMVMVMMTFSCVDIRIVTPTIPKMDEFNG